MDKIFAASLLAFPPVDYMPTLTLVWVALAGLSVVLIRRRGGKPGLPLPHPPVIHDRERTGAERAYNIDAAERRIHVLEERLDFVEDLLRGRQSTDRDALHATSPRTNADTTTPAESASQEEA